MKKVINGIKKTSPFFKRLYSIISLISTLTVLTGVILFLCGKWLFGDVCDDDLTMQRIKKQMPDNLTITDIYMEDIHGVGNESMIVLASNSDVGNRIANQLLIFDKVENDILNQIYNLFGYGSNYKCSYLFSLEYMDETWLEELGVESNELGYSLEIVDVIDLTGDLSKEIVVNFRPMDDWGNIAGSRDYYDTGIFSYSYEEHKYYLLGTYPPYHDDRIPQRKSNDRNRYNEAETFKLAGGLSGFYSEYFAREKIYSDTVMVRTKRIWDFENESYITSHQFNISVYKPIFDIKKNKLKWEKVFSEDTDEYMEQCSKKYVQKFLDKKGVYIKSIEK